MLSDTPETVAAPAPPQQPFGMYGMQGPFNTPAGPPFTPAASGQFTPPTFPTYGTPPVRRRREQLRTAIPRREQPTTATRTLYLGVPDITGRCVEENGAYPIIFDEESANVLCMAEKFKEAAGIEEDCIITNRLGCQINDTVATRGMVFWRQNARLLFAVTLADFQAFRRGRRAQAITPNTPNTPRHMSRSRSPTSDRAVERATWATERLVCAAETAARLLEDAATQLPPAAPTPPPPATAVAMDIPAFDRALLDAGIRCAICADVTAEPVVMLCCDSRACGDVVL